MGQRVNGARVIETAISGASTSSSTKTTNYPITDTDDLGVIFTNGNFVTITLPTASANTDRELTISNIHATGLALIDGEGAELINSVATVYLFSQYNYLKIKCNGTKWIVIDFNINITSSWLPRSDWTAVHLGLTSLIYDGLTGTFDIGEVVTEGTTGATGIITGDTGTTLILKDVGGGGVFTNDNTLAGGTSGATAVVNGDTKNTDSNVNHLFSASLVDIDVKVYFNSTASDTAAWLGVSIADGFSTGSLGVRIIESDTDTLLLDTGGDGIAFMNDAGANALMAAQDWFYKIVMIRNRIK